MPSPNRWSDEWVENEYRHYMSFARRMFANFSPTREAIGVRDDLMRMIRSEFPPFLRAAEIKKVYIYYRLTQREYGVTR